jgi:hypothetical protein
MKNVFRFDASTLIKAAKAALIASAIVVAGTAAAAGEFGRPWTTVGSAGTVDDFDVADVLFGGNFAYMRNKDAFQAATIRYNVTAVDGLQYGGARAMQIRFRDKNDQGYVRARLIETDTNTGAYQTRMEFNSNNYAPSVGYRTHSVIDCSPKWSFDFVNKVYHLEVYMVQYSVADVVTFTAARIGPTIC